MRVLRSGLGLVSLISKQHYQQQSSTTTAKKLKLTEKIKYSSKPVVMIDFYADWCGPCKLIEPILKRVSEKEGIALVKVNVDEDQESAMEYKISALPTVVFVDKDGKEKKRLLGLKSESEIMAVIKSVV